MIDSNGFRLNVGIILINDEGKLFWARRIGQDAWQFPQGGLDDNETCENALYRELYEEVGLKPEHVELIAQSSNWLAYRLPKHFLRNDRQPLCVGQKQKWFLLKLTSPDSAIQLDASAKPEFDGWKWVSYWFPLHQVVPFKREVYRRALTEFLPIIHGTVAKKGHLDPLDT